MIKIYDKSLIDFSQKSIDLGLEQEEMFDFNARAKIEWILKCHKDVNHFYDDYLPYSFHLNRVADNFMKFYNEIGFSLISPFDARDILIACFGHDLIEDARKTYNDIKEVLGQRIADLIYACSELRGKDFLERKGPDFWRVLNETPFSSIVKLCDVQANLDYTLWTKDQSKLKKQIKVYNIMKENLKMDEFSLYIFNNIGKYLS